MTNDLDERLNCSAPAVAEWRSVAADVALLAERTRTDARARRARRLRGIGIPVLIGVLLVGGGTAAFASPLVRSTIGLSAPSTPTATPSVIQSTTAPYPNCRITFILTDGETTPLNQAGKNAMSAARAFLAHIDQAAILKSPEFAKEFGKPVVVASPSSGAPAVDKQEQALAAQLNATTESFALNDIISRQLYNYLEQRDSQNGNLDPSAVGLSGRSSDCGPQ